MATEKRLIDADVLDGILKDFESRYQKAHFALSAKAIANARQIVYAMKTVDAVEVVHGRWLYDSGSGKWFCSACDENALSFKRDTIYGDELYEECLTDYCPNCGADMRERKDK